MTPPFSQESPETIEFANTIREALFMLVDDHERLRHHGETCVENRVGLVAWLAHCLGMSLQHVPIFVDILAVYAEHHEEEGRT